MNKKNSSLLFFILLILSSCVPTKEKSKLNILEYSLGDKISYEFEVLEDSESLPYLEAQYISDPRIRIRIIDSTIVTIAFSKMSESEYQELIKDVSISKYGFQRQIGELPGGLKLDGEVSHWVNGVIHEELFLSKRSKQGRFIYSAFFSKIDSLTNEDSNEDYPMIEITN